MTTETPEYAPIAEYAIIGNCRTAALVSRDGSVDWLCLDRFDSPAVFAALLDTHEGGRFRIRPAGEFESERRYLDGSAVLETTFRTAGGVLRLTDVMPVASEETKDRKAWPQQQLLRRVECVEGEVEVDVLYEPRPGYARIRPRLEDHDALGWWCPFGGRILSLMADAELEACDGDCTLRGRASLAEGDVRIFSLTYADDEPLVFCPLGDADWMIEESLSWWREWASACSAYDGPWPEAVLRSAITLKLLTYAPSGAVIAAATTSLPEALGGERNWDYRFCWLRDASWTFRALFDLGFHDEARAFYDWLLHTTRLTAPEVQTLYGVMGETRLNEETLDHLEGYRGSRPVRVGNDAYGQLQLDVYGAVVSAAFEYVRRGGTLDDDEAARLVELGKVVCRRWEEPDEGIWEIRGGRRHHTYSKVMCWVALDRLLTLADEGHCDIPRERFEKNREMIRETVEEKAWREAVGSYVGTFDGDTADAALLRLPLVGYLEPGDQRASRTYEWLLDELSENGLLRRYPTAHDPHEKKEGAFGICSFWAAECQAWRGNVEAAEEQFERILGQANDVGLFAEEIDPQTGDFLGNAPQAYTHVGLIIAALAIEAAREREAPQAAEEEPEEEPLAVHGETEGPSGATPPDPEEA